MRERLLALATAASVFLVFPAAHAAGASRPLTIYFIDVEGGQSTLLVTADHHSLLIDTGWAGEGAGYRPGDPHRARDANRILAAAREAGIEQIDILLITHFHTDHDGGVTELSQLLPLRTFVDHGEPHPDATINAPDTASAFEDYSKVRGRGSQHLQPHPGDRLPLPGVAVTVVSSAGETLTRPLGHAGERNSRCQAQASPARDPYENPRSTGVLVEYGRFRFLDLGDLTGEPLFKLACPKSLIGPVDVYLVAHHGGPDAADPATFAAFYPRIAVMNNGVSKGGARNTYEALHHVQGLEDVWQLHASAEAADANFPPRYIANLDESTAHWIKLVARSDGSFDVLNPRTGEQKHYGLRP